MKKLCLALLMSTALVSAVSARAEDHPGRYAEGALVALSSDSISVRPDSGELLTCSLSALVAPQLTALHLVVGERVRAACELHEAHYVLVKVGRPEAAPPAPVQVHAPRYAEGKLTALSAASVTVAPDSGDALTCAIPPARAGSVAELHLVVGERVRLYCEFADGGYRLAKLARPEKPAAPPVEKPAAPPVEKPQPPATEPQHVTRYVEGTLASLSSVSLTVKPDSGESLTCAIPTGRAGSVSELKLALGERVRMLCELAGDHAQLVKLARPERSTAPPAKKKPALERPKKK